ncbi:flavin-dependent monooxygenase [Chamberlinius hualienensis]
MAVAVDVVVVGAGFSGLVAIKSCLEENLSVLCFEKTDSIGGNWKFNEDGVSCMRSTVINASKELMAFSDFPFPPEAPNFMINSEFQEYLESYANKFGLTDQIQLQYEVIDIAGGPQFEQVGNWKVTAKNQKTGNNMVVIAGKLMMCVGIFTKPHFESFEGLDNFQGKIIHSSEYKRAAGYENKNIVVIGNGNSAYDIAVELGNTAKKMYCLIKPGTLVGSRMAYNGMPYDVTVFTRFNMFKWSLFPKQFPKDLLKMCCAPIDRELYGLSVTGYNPEAHFLAINDQLPYSILNGRVLMKPPIKKFTANGVIFTNDPFEYPIDTVIMATGFDIPEINFSNSDLTAWDLRYGLYKRVFPYKLSHPTIAFIVYARFAGITTCLAELQSRWAVKVFTNKCRLPTKPEMKKDVESTADMGTTTKLPVMSMHCLDHMARFIGAMPNYYTMLFTDPKLYFTCMFGAFTAYQYRLVGPNSWPKAREAILTASLRIKAGFGQRNQRKQQRIRKWVVKIMTVGTLGVILVYFLSKKGHNYIRIVNQILYR